MTCKDLDDVVFMALFGRPLYVYRLWTCIPSLTFVSTASRWRSAVHKFIEAIFDKFTHGSSIDPLRSTPQVTDAEDGTRQDICAELLAFARSKLLRKEDVLSERIESSPEAQTAVLDVRIMLSYEASREDARRRVMELIESHMRTVFSVPRGREYFRSGYPSEPILVEAAAQQLHYWRTTEIERVDPALTILTENLNHDLLSRGELGEATGRMLLIRARDAAAVCEASNSDSVVFSNAVLLTTFIKKLFGENLAEEILKSCPDNLGTDHQYQRTTFGAMFHDAVINFTHFSKWGDNLATSENAALVSFIRHMAPICRNNAESVDAAIPVLLTREGQLCPKKMTMILIQFKLRAKAGSSAAYDIKQNVVKLFPPSRSDTKTGQYRPYITLLMELGVTHPLHPLAETPTTHKLALEKRKRKQESDLSDQPGDVKTTPATLSKVILGAPGNRKRSDDTHPRYKIIAYGCSSEVYGVIDQHEDQSYMTLIRCSQLLGEHPRMDIRSLTALRNQKPFFCFGEESFGWVSDHILDPPISELGIQRKKPRRETEGKEEGERLEGNGEDEKLESTEANDAANSQDTGDVDMEEASQGFEGEAEDHDDATADKIDLQLDDVECGCLVRD